MKRLIYLALCGAMMTGTISCKKYLEIVPKGQKIPQTFNDYKALVEHSDAHTFDYGNQIYVSNDFYMPLFSQPTVNLSTINFNWQEDKSRIDFLNNDAGYNAAYRGIFVYNVIINNIYAATTGTEAEKARLTAQAKLGRAMFYFYLITSYAKMYDPATATQDRGVLLNTSDNMETVLRQASVQEIYDFILNDLNAALPDLPATSEDVFFGNKGAGFAMLSRYHLFIKDYTKAAMYADSALNRKNTLFDYVEYYNQNKVLADGNATSINIPRFEFNNPENYIFHYASAYVQTQGFYISMLRESDSTQYDMGDARFKVNYALTPFGTEKVWAYRRNDNVNGGGIRTPEIYYIKAECLARAGKFNEAMELVNTVRRKRIRPEFYSDVSAIDLKGAMAQIYRDLRNEFRGTGLNYLTLRRLNNDPQFAQTLTKKEGDNTYSIKPDSHIWIMPFSINAIAQSKGVLTQNSK
ncbi:RagB/SusD family nutrient uptake outer membrane protein [Chitinophaga silvatica]|uniref:RagB/SusD family nutrient uptake outer membrane protein n=1 Tax=Chitinophaga silvatica TaxID=2282649 RepID=A0A3E1Y2W5_9BACT|nr:RagB/SusD family nutrient uptake outer membrane protein [Chitinophaga silvatica]RFS19028.1 RagB/SusD family nutrient uptake outer membrane protein [Chitinophaga silvatica]